MLVPTHVTERDRDGRFRTVPFDPKRHGDTVLTDDDALALAELVAEVEPPFTYAPAGAGLSEEED